jgi:plastocyanin
MPTETDTSIMRRTHKALRIPAITLVAALSLAACASGASRYTGLAPTPTPVASSLAPTAAPAAPAAAGRRVAIKGFAFLPATIQVTVGTTVEWTNGDLVAHTVTSDSPLFDSGNLQNKQTFVWTFDTAGTYAYHCTIHPNMVATITVGG